MRPPLLTIGELHEPGVDLWREQCSSPVRPCVPITIRSIARSSRPIGAIHASHRDAALVLRGSSAMSVRSTGRLVAITQEMTFQKILCATDFSLGADQALRVAAHLAKQAGAEVVLVHCAHASPVASPAVIQQSTEAGEAGLQRSIRDATAVGVGRVTSKLVTGDLTGVELDRTQRERGHHGDRSRPARL
jgi:hypothetical protein